MPNSTVCRHLVTQDTWRFTPICNKEYFHTRGSHLNVSILLKILNNDLNHETCHVTIILPMTFSIIYHKVWYSKHIYAEWNSPPLSIGTVHFCFKACCVVFFSFHWGIREMKMYIYQKYNSIISIKLNWNDCTSLDLRVWLLGFVWS